MTSHIDEDSTIGETWSVLYDAARNGEVHASCPLASIEFCRKHLGDGLECVDEAVVRIGLHLDTRLVRLYGVGFVCESGVNTEHDTFSFLS